MAPMGTHSAEKGDKHIWVIAAIAASAAVVVTATWTGIGNVAGFPPIPLGHLRIPTGLTLATGTEGYTGYALWAWLGGAAGERSRKFAGVTAICALALSLSVQAPYHLMLAEHWAHAPVLLVIGSSSVPVIDVILGSVLGHLQLSDKAAAKAAAEAQAAAERQAAIERAENDERAALRRQLAEERRTHEAELTEMRDAAQAEIEAERGARETALRQAQEAAQAAASSAAQVSAMTGRHAEADEELAELRVKVSALEEARHTADEALAEATRRADAAEAKAERLSRKLAPNSGTGRNRNAAPKDAGQNRTTVPNDVDARAQALAILLEEPNITGKELGERCGRGERWGQLRKSELAGHVADGTGSAGEGGSE